MIDNEDENIVDSVYGYIEKIVKITEGIDDNMTVVYRGEPIYYPTYCQPNLFRSDYFKKNKFFEKSLFDELDANKLTKGKNYLEKAIDAQHGGFPSRLLDVTFNSLIALYFATTPHIKEVVDKYDEDNGYVYIFFIQNLFCPSGSSVTDTFDSIVNRKNWICKNNIFQKNHKLIDHIKMNNRIVAQQGAVILFQGDDVSSIQRSDYIKITINSFSKKKIRKDLKTLFGIHNGYIYPEIDNLVADIKYKSNKISNVEFNFKNELSLVLNNLDRELKYFLIYIRNIDTVCIDKIVKILMQIEEIIYSYKLGLCEIKEYIECSGNNESDINIYTYKDVIKEYNSIVNRFITKIKYYIDVHEIEISEEELMIYEETRDNGE